MEPPVEHQAQADAGADPDEREAPELVVLGGGIGQAPGFMEAVAEQLRALAPVLPEVKVSALGADAVVEGCLAAGLDTAWQLVTAAVPAPSADGAAAT